VISRGKVGEGEILRGADQDLSVSSHMRRKEMSTLILSLGKGEETGTSGGGERARSLNPLGKEEGGKEGTFIFAKRGGGGYF